MSKPAANVASKSEAGGTSTSGSRGGPKISEGDWLCADTECANWNFAWRTSCNRCGAEKASSGGSGAGSDDGGSSGGSSYSKKKKLGQEIGKAMAEKSRGLFSADDWQCNKCGNVNWARRHQCNVCNAPRYGEVEERTGYGGGYNDRGVVEYKERVESDDEWDEFGRKKKRKSARRKENSECDDDTEEPDTKKRKSERRSSSPEVEKRKRVEPEKKEEKKLPSSSEEEEDDDDDEDGDLSKYDLSGWGDEEEAN